MTGTQLPSSPHVCPCSSHATLTVQRFNATLVQPVAALPHELARKMDTAVSACGVSAKRAVRRNEVVG